MKKLDLDEKRIINLYSKEISGNEIARIMKVSKQTIYRRLEKNNILIRKYHTEDFKQKVSERNKNKRLNLDIKKIINLYISGYSVPQISKEIEVSDTVIYKRLIENNISIRKNWKPNKEQRDKQSKRTQGKGNPNYKGGYIKKVCEFCKNTYSIKRAGKTSENRKFCSKECMFNFTINENHPNWRGGISNLPYSFDFNEELKELIRKRDNYQCQICGKKQIDLDSFHKKLSVHHVDYNKVNQNPDNLITLCSTCHMRTNFNREYWMNYFNQLKILNETNLFCLNEISIKI